MIRPLTCVTVLMACGSGFFLYQTKHQAQVVDRQIERAVKAIAATQMQTRELAAAWTVLGSPGPAAATGRPVPRHQAGAPSQFVAMADLDSRLPAPRARAAARRRHAVAATLPADAGSDTDADRGGRTGRIAARRRRPPPRRAGRGRRPRGRRRRTRLRRAGQERPRQDRARQGRACQVEPQQARRRGPPPDHKPSDLPRPAP